MFPAQLVSLGYYTAQNAEEWIDLPKFMRWLGHQAQKAVATPPTSPMKRIPVPRGLPPMPAADTMSQQPSSSPYPLSSPLPLPMLPSGSGGISSISSSPIRVPDSEQEEFPVFPTVPNKRKRKESTPEPDTSDSDSEVVVKKKAKRRAPKGTADHKLQAITRQLRVPEIRDVDKVFACWTVPQTDIEIDFAYRVDLTNDESNALSMAAIIKSQDQDAWGGGSAGSTKKPTKVLALDGVPCQVAKHDCQGVYVCDQLDQDLLHGHERYEPDDDEMRELFDAERTVNLRETSSMAIRAAAFYAEIHNKPCPHLNDGVFCTGLPPNFDGKSGFIGCENYSPDQPRTHRFITINRDVKEDLIRELLSNNGRFVSDVNVDSESAICARGKIVHRPCGANIQIFSPIDHDDRRGIVYLTGPHNHPKFPSTKVSRDGKDAYRRAVDAAGVSGLTVLKCDSAASTSKIFNGHIPAELDPGLANSRIKRGLIAKVKRNENPHGMGIEGVIFRQKRMQSLPREKQYIWRVTSEYREELIITMLPYLANLIHRVKVSLHDNTYARVHGEWKEWEVVIWDDRCNIRVTIGRIYSKHETYEVFKKMWPGLFETIARVTGSEVKFKFIDGQGLKAILVDGNKPQANALGDYIGSRNRPHLSGIHEKNPKLILPNVLRTCDIHVNRKFTSIASIVPDEPMSRIRGYWIADKDSIPWFFPSINEFLSKIPEEDWYLTPGDTNLNESAHPYTNQHTGTNLALLEAIDRAYDMDLQVEAKIRTMEQSCVLVNHHNTKPQRDRKNASRRTSHYHKALERTEARFELENLDDSIQESAAKMKELRERRKALKEASGIKKTKRSGEKAKETLPDAEEFAGLSDAENIQSSPVHPALRLCNDASPVRANLDVELEPGLEPLFPHSEGNSYLELSGDLVDYIP
ncbi:hypothetical protein B0H16DRAFT_1310196 [Mycena metata]|uniref:Uncharacterized protein n=1 Tax=Mycena metata TaxID=1033252 RepID=A0AAD7JLZ9_9AGAR|nr:hypothetical protein B0H16DRAFT_1310196 [Mycena metata]